MTANGRSCFNYNHSGVKLWYQLSHWLIIHLYLGTSLVTSCPCPPAENILWFDLNFLSLTLSPLECKISNHIAEHTIESCTSSKFKMAALILFRGLAIFARKREVCAPALVLLKMGRQWTTYNKLRQLVSLLEGRMLPAVLAWSLMTEIKKFVDHFSSDLCFNGQGTLLTASR